MKKERLFDLILKPFWICYPLTNSETKQYLLFWRLGKEVPRSSAEPDRHLGISPWSSRYGRRLPRCWNTGITRQKRGPRTDLSGKARGGKAKDNLIRMEHYQYSRYETFQVRHCLTWAASMKKKLLNYPLKHSIWIKMLFKLLSILACKSLCWFWELGRSF